MQSEITIQSENSDQVKSVLDPSLVTEGPVKHEIESENSSVEIKTETDTLGQLRGCTDTVFRLTTLSKKILER